MLHFVTLYCFCAISQWRFTLRTENVIDFHHINFHRILQFTMCGLFGVGMEMRQRVGMGTI